MSESNVAIIYYTRTGNTETIAQMIRDGLMAREVVADMIKIEVEGVVNFRRIGKMANEDVPLLNTEFDLSDYDLTIIGTPIWGGRTPMPLISYLRNAADGWDGRATLFLTGMRKVRKNEAIVEQIEREIGEYGFGGIEAWMILKFRRGKLVEGDDSIPDFIDRIEGIYRELSISE